MKNNYAFIDYLKLFFCFCVVGIHAEIFFDFNKLLDYTIYHALFRCAVPFFFVASGFFLGLKLFKINSIKEKNTIINKYLKRLLIPYLFWLLIGSFRVIAMLDGSLLTKIIKFIRVTLFNPWNALWYIWATIVFLIIYKIILNITKDKINYKLLFFISLLLYIFALLCNNYYFLIENTIIQNIVDLYLKIFIVPRNGIFVSIFIIIGLLIALYKDKFKINNQKLIIANIVLFILLIFEVIITKNLSFQDDRSLYITFILFIPLLFILFTRFKSNRDTTLIRNLSTGIYFIHCNIIILLRYFIVNNYIVYFLTLFISTIILLILYKIDNKYINKLIK